MVADERQAAVIGDKPYRHIGEVRRDGIVCVADHASNHVPAGIDLKIDSALMHEHIAIDIGVAGVAERLAQIYAIPAHLACVSRLVCDFNRLESDPAVVPETSDGHPIPGNVGADVEQRLAAYYRPYHERLAAFIAEARPRLILSLHSFTPALQSCDQPRPWEVALLHKRDDRAARVAIREFVAIGLTVGDNEPYSGKHLNATMDRHAEALGIPYCSLEVRQDQIADEPGQERWAALIAEVMGRVLLALDRQ